MTAEHDGWTVLFCRPGRRQAFLAQPDVYLAGPGGGAT